MPNVKTLSEINCKFCGEKVNDIQHIWPVVEKPGEFYHGHWTVINNTIIRREILKRCHESKKKEQLV